MQKTSLRLDELAEEWDVSRRTVEREIKRGELAAFKVGATWRVKAEEILRYRNRAPAALSSKRKARP